MDQGRSADVAKEGLVLEIETGVLESRACALVGAFKFMPRRCRARHRPPRTSTGVFRDALEQTAFGRAGLGL
jgi:hypothetical protein